MDVTRRTFLGGGAAVLGGAVIADRLRFFQPATAVPAVAHATTRRPATATSRAARAEAVFRTGHSNNCDGACGHLIHVIPLPQTLAAGADLLGHWWSRPLAGEVETWLAHIDLAHAVFRRTPLPTPPAVTDLRDLLDEHERLFVGPGPVPCPPFESCWRSDVPLDLRRSLLGPCTSDLRELYLRLGLELSFTGTEFTDHLPVELEALSVALATLDGGDVSRSLFVDHLGRWLPQLADAVLQETRHQFYRDLARLTMRWAASAAAVWADPAADG